VERIFGGFRDHYYVAQANLEAVDVTQADEMDVQHRYLSLYFPEGRCAATGRFIIAPKLAYCFPLLERTSAYKVHAAGQPVGEGEATTATTTTSTVTTHTSPEEGRIKDGTAAAAEVANHHPDFGPRFYAELDKALVGSRQLVRRELTLALAGAAIENSDGERDSSSSGGSNNNSNININSSSGISGSSSGSSSSSSNSSSSSTSSSSSESSSPINGTSLFPSNGPSTAAGLLRMADMLAVLRSAGQHSAAVDVESLVWLCWMSHPDPSVRKLMVSESSV